MTADQIPLLRDTYEALLPMAERAAAQFYDRVFERAPGVGVLFHGDMARQGHRLVAMLGSAIDRLDDPEGLDDTLRALGLRHAGYGVVPAHYDVVGGALIDTLALALGPRFTPVHRRAWAAFYAHLRAVMLPADAALKA